MPSNFLRLFGWVRRSRYIIVFVLIGCTQLLAQEPTTYPAVQLDLNTGSFLTSLPFDQPFLIQGRAAQDMTRIQVTFEEFFDAGHLFAEQPKRMAAFKTGVRAILDSLHQENTDIATNEGLRTLERRLSDMLWQQAGSASGLSISSAQNILPWNWGNWLLMKQSKSLRLLTNGSMFDSSDNGTSARERFRALVVQHQSGIQQEDATDRLIDFVVDEAQGVRIVSAPNPSPAIRGTWQKLPDRASVQKEPLPTAPSSRWNRLEQRLQGGEVPDAGEFHLVVSPLEANRTYLVRVQASSTAPEQTIPLTTYFWSDTKSSDYVSMDVGLLYAREIRETSVYIGTNIYLRPVVKGIPLQTRGGFLRRFAFTLGLAVQNIEDVRSTRRALIGPISAVLGAGIRVSQHVRLGGGVLIFRERDPETFPLTTRTSLTGTP